MKEFIDKLIERLEEERKIAYNTYMNYEMKVDLGRAFGAERAIDIVNQLAEEYKGGWIPCSERLPQVETEVYIVAKRKYRDGGVRYITTTAMYEDGTVRENDSCWRWEDIEGEWDEDEDCYIIPEGWWEDRHYNPDDVYNNAVDDEVIAWMPLPALPAPYQQKEGVK